ncbi:E3 ubiquitin-protein ligase hel2 [Chlorella vulgaris]
MAKGGVLQKVGKALASVGIKAPWKYTGPVSGPEYMDHLPKAVNYRAVAPASQPIRAAVPQSEDAYVYDIKYYVRDTRRAHLPGGTIKMEQGKYDVAAKDEALEALDTSPTPNKPHKWPVLRPILEQDNNGYTFSMQLVHWHGVVSHSVLWNRAAFCTESWHGRLAVRASIPIASIAAAKSFTAYGPCGHKDACSKCVSRLRSVIKDPRCVYCQVPADSVFVTRFMGDYTASVPPEEFDALPARARRGELKHLESAQAFFDDAAHFREISGLCSYTHPRAWQDSPGDAPHKPFPSLRALKAHLMQQHKLGFCDICLEGRKVFVSEQQLYTKAELERHMRGGDVEGAMAAAGYKGHPECRFCRKRYFGENELYQHMHAGHEQCFLCRRSNPEKYVYYRDYEDLENHFKRDHYLCPHPACLEKKFVVFQGEQELKTHTAREHGETLSKLEKKAALTLHMNFQYRRDEAEGGRGGGRGGRGSRSGGGRGGGGGGSSFSSGGIPAEAPHPLAAVASGERRAVVIGGAASVPIQLQQRNLSGSRGNLQEAVSASMESAQVENAVRASQQQQQQQQQAPDAPGLSDADFPAVSGGYASGGGAGGGRWAGAAGGAGSAGGLTEDQFPSLPGATKSAKRRAAKNKSLASVLGGGSGGGEVRVLHAGGGRPPLAPGPHHFPALSSLAPAQQQQQQQRQDGAAGTADAGSSGGSRPSSAEAGLVALQPEDWDSVLPRSDRRAAASASTPAAGGYGSLPRPPSTQELAGPPPEEPQQQRLKARQEARQQRKLQQQEKLQQQQEKQQRDKQQQQQQQEQGQGQPPLTPAAGAAQSLQAGSATAGPAGISEALRAANKQLIDKIRSQLDVDQFAQFRQQSASWVRGQTSSRQYHEAVAELGLVSLIPDLASTCPDASKRVELLAVHQTAFTAEGKAKGKGKWVPPEAAAVSARLAEQHSSWQCGACTLVNAPAAWVCEACGQRRPSASDAGSHWNQKQQQQQQQQQPSTAQVAPRPSSPAPPPVNGASSGGWAAAAKPLPAAPAAAPRSSAAAVAPPHVPAPSPDSFPALPAVSAAPTSQGQAGASGSGDRKAKKGKQPLDRFIQSTRVHPQNAWKNPSLRGQWADGGGGTLATEERALLEAYGRKAAAGRK